jgi:AcrR family transcriptional regulator
MSRQRQPRKYRAPERAAAAARTRSAIVAAAQRSFEQHGWNGATVRLIADAADVSPKTVEVLFGTKAKLLQAAVDYAIRGDTDAVAMPQRQTIIEIEAAPTAARMLELHAAHLRSVNARSARLAAVVEQAATTDDTVAALWKRMNHNRRFAVRWATDTLLRKRGHRLAITRGEVEAIFWVALDWGTYRTLTEHAGLTPGGYERWLRGYYQSTLLSQRRNRPANDRTSK